MRVAGDVHVVGAGLIGLCVAYELARRGASVTVWDREEPARAASWAGAGMLAPFSEDTGDAAMVALGAASLQRYPAFVEDLFEQTGVDARLRSEGTLHLALDDAEATRLLDLAARFRANGGDVTWLEREAVLVREPLVSRAVVGGLFVANEAQVDNRRLGRALLAACEGLGVNIERISHLAVACDERRVRGVRTERGFTAASCIVNAAGAWAGALDGIPERVRVAVRPVAGEMLALAVPRLSMRALVWLGHTYLVPRDDGRLLVGATVVERGFDARVTAGGIATLLAAALRAAPTFADFAVVETWAGLRPAAHDGRPYLGSTSLDGYVVATGHFRNGILLAPVTAAAIASLIVTGTSEIPLADFVPERARYGETGAGAAG